MNTQDSLSGRGVSKRGLIVHVGRHRPADDEQQEFDSARLLRLSSVINLTELGLSLKASVVSATSVLDPAAIHTHTDNVYDRVKYYPYVLIRARYHPYVDHPLPHWLLHFLSLHTHALPPHSCESRSSR
jgi:hypothetical protein